MLTFFEYLRQRALESVLSGAREAMDILEGEKVFEKPPTPIQSPMRTRVEQVQSDNSTTETRYSEPVPSETTSSQVNETVSGKDRLPEPRVRSHHNRKGSRKS